MFKRFLKRKLTAYLQACIAPAIVEATAAKVLLGQRRERLLVSALHCEEPGVEEMREEAKAPVIVSLTTYGQRLYEVALAIESIMQGTVKPNGIVLWRDEQDTRPLPLTLKRQVARGLKVLPTRDIRSYKKLLPALQEFPNAHIVTIDDDVFYPHDFLEALLTAHEQAPRAIIANMVMKLTRDAQGIPQGIRQWPYCAAVPEPTDDNDLFFEGFGGVFYPAGCLPEEVFQEATFSTLCPTADDIWFNAMARLAHTPIHVCPRSDYDFIAAVNNASQTTSLYSVNNGCENLNDRQLRAVWEHYHLQGQ